MYRVVFTAIIVTGFIGLSAFAGVEDDFLRYVRDGNYTRVASLLKKYPRIAKAKISADRTALHVAAAYGRIKVAELLLHYGADIHARDRYEYTPLDYAVVKKQYAMIRWLLKRGANPNCTTLTSRSTPVFIAARNNDPLAAQILIAAGASVTHQSAMGTPLHEAAAWGSVSVAKVLLDAGASVHARAPWHGGTPLHDAALRNALHVAQLLVEHGARIEETDSRGQTPLHAACARVPTPQFIQWLLDSGANPNVKDKDGNTPLHILAGSYQLLSEMESVARKRGNPSKAKVWLKQFKERWVMHTLDSARVLIAHGADPNVVNHSGQTPADIARRSGFMELVSLLIGHGKAK